MAGMDVLSADCLITSLPQLSYLLDTTDTMFSPLHTQNSSHSRVTPYEAVPFLWNSLRICQGATVNENPLIAKFYSDESCICDCQVAALCDW